MLSLALILPAAILCCAAVGHFVLRGLGALDFFDDAADAFAVEFWLGAGTLGSLLEAAALIGPVTWWMGLLAAAVMGGLGVLSGFRPDFLIRVSTRMRWTLGALFLLVVAHCAALPVDAFDTALYHQSAVSFLSQFGLVRGAVLFHSRLGFTSSWFALAAPFNHGWLAGRAAAAMSGMVLFVGGWHWASKFDRLANRAMRGPDWLVLVAYPGLAGAAAFWHYDLALGTDLPSWIGAVMVAWTMLILQRRGATGSGCCVPLALATLGFAIKLSLIAVAPVALLFAIRRRGAALRYSALCFIPILVTLAANIKTSGCPLYPSSLGCLQVNWTLNPEIMRSLARDLEKTSATYHSAIPAWIRNREMVVLLAFSLFGSLAVLVRKTRCPGLLWVLALSWSGIALLLLEAPIPRFGLGYFLIPIGAAACVWLEGRALPWVGGTRFFVAAMAALLGGCGVADVALRGLDWSKARSHVFLPDRMARGGGERVHRYNRDDDFWMPLRLNQAETNGIRYVYPSDTDQCWDAPLCTPAELDSDVHLRNPGEGIGGGFERSSALK